MAVLKRRLLLAAALLSLVAACPYVGAGVAEHAVRDLTKEALKPNQSFKPNKPIPRVYIDEISTERTAHEAHIAEWLGERPGDPVQPFTLVYYPIEPAWRVRGYFTPAARATRVDVVSDLGFSTPMRHAGEVTIEMNAKRRRFTVYLDAEAPTDTLLLVFEDKNGKPARYVPVVAEPDQWVSIDFNRAYGQPCAYVAGAPCTKAPKRNRLKDMIVEAGEAPFPGPPLVSSSAPAPSPR